MLSVYGMKDELRRPMMLLVKAAIPKNCKEETSKPFSKQKEIRRPLLVDLANSVHERRCRTCRTL